MVAKNPFCGVSKFERGTERTFCVFNTGTIRLVDDEHVCDFQDPSLDRLNLIAKPGRFDNERGMREPRHIHLALPRANRFDDDDLIACGIKDLYEGSCL